MFVLMDVDGMLLFINVSNIVKVNSIVRINFI